MASATAVRNIGWSSATNTRTTYFTRPFYQLRAHESQESCRNCFFPHGHLAVKVRILTYRNHVLRCEGLDPAHPPVGGARPRRACVHRVSRLTRRSANPCGAHIERVCLSTQGWPLGRQES